MNTGRGPAFPVPDTHHPDGQIQYGTNGMSLRDWFAGQETLADIRDDLSSEYFDALAGCPMPLPPRGKILSAFDYIEIAEWDARWRATLKYIRADAMLRARERGQEGANDDAWALDAAVTIHPAVGPESIHPTTWTARYWDGVRTLEESGPTIAAAIRALRAKVEGGAR